VQNTCARHHSAPEVQNLYARHHSAPIMQNTCARHHSAPEVQNTCARHHSAVHGESGTCNHNGVRLLSASMICVRTGNYRILVPSRPPACHRTCLTRDVTTPAGQTLIRIPECLAALHLDSCIQLCFIYRVFHSKLYTGIELCTSVHDREGTSLCTILWRIDPLLGRDLETNN
jgi:hypothetical protein